MTPSCQGPLLLYPFKGDPINTHVIYGVFMGLIIKGPLSQAGPSHHFLYDKNYKWS